METTSTCSRSIRERLTSLGGHLDLRDVEPHGTRLTLRAPLCQLMQEETRQLIQTARVMYGEGLRRLADSLCPPGGIPAPHSLTSQP